jgi:hypothetical protein
MQATDLVGINGITRALVVYMCQQGVYPRGHVLPLRLPHYEFTSRSLSKECVIKRNMNPFLKSIIYRCLGS